MHFPEGWQIVCLKDSSQAGNDTFVDGPFGSELKVADYTSNGIMLIQLQNIGDGYFRPENRKYTSESKYKQLLRHSTFPGDIVIAKMSDPVARAAIVPAISDKFLVVADSVKLRVDESKFDKKFLLYTINSDYVRKQAIQKSKGTTRLRINLSELKQLQILKPPLGEQKRISSIISMVDELIQKTDQIIKQTQRLKKGLMQKLLTKGIGHTKFKRTEIDEIPQEWEVTTVKQITLEHKQGYYTKEKYVNQGVLLTRISDLYNPRLSYESMPYVNIDEKTFNQFKVSTGDFLMARSGATIGRYGIAAEDKCCVFGSYIIRFRFDPSKIDNYFFGKLYESRYILGQLMGIKQSTSNININAENIKSMKIPLPTIDEQRKILYHLQFLDLDLGKKVELRNTWKKCKKSLMQNLLTGKIRVKV